jgi:hypothetical protein
MLGHETPLLHLTADVLDHSIRDDQIGSVCPEWQCSAITHHHGPGRVRHALDVVGGKDGALGGQGVLDDRFVRLLAATDAAEQQGSRSAVPHQPNNEI